MNFVYTFLLLIGPLGHQNHRDRLVLPLENLAVQRLKVLCVNEVKVQGVNEFF